VVINDIFTIPNPFAMNRKLTLAFALLVLAIHPSIAVTPDSVVQATNKSVSQVLGVYTQKAEDTNPKNNGEAFAGDVIKIKISNPGQFLASKPTDQSKLLLYIDGLPFTGVYSTYFDQYAKANAAGNAYPAAVSVPFVLLRNEATKEMWDYLYRNSSWRASKITVKISVGWEGMFPLEPGKNVNNNLNIIYFKDCLVEIFMIFYLAFVVAFIVIAFRSKMLRGSAQLSAEPGGVLVYGPYSLAQTQLMFWTIVILGGFIYTLVLTSISNSINTSVMLLLGISITTTGAATFVDYYKKVTPSITVNPKPTEGSFFKDILSDGDTYSVQRIQTAVWNLVLGIYFVYYTMDNKAMPVFPDALLALAGVSSVGYVASKRAENV
jgi:hypothetical protein